VKFFLCKLVPPRPTFAQDMTEAETKLMQEHVMYWTELAGRGIAVVFGPVADPKGAWGVAIVEVEGEADARALAAIDPTIKSDRNFNFEIYSMPIAVLRKPAA
jgi:uncharacterized protein YciI